MYIETKPEGIEISDTINMCVVSCLYVGITKSKAIEQFRILRKRKLNGGK